jgi:hypothetical protein
MEEKNEIPLLKARVEELNQVSLSPPPLVVSVSYIAHRCMILCNWNQKQQQHCYTRDLRTKSRHIKRSW